MTTSVDTDDLLRTSQAHRGSAGKLLRDLRLIEMWQEHGTVEITGSYRWDLMLGSDIDLTVVNPACDLEMALEILNRFARKGPFLRFAFIDTIRGKPSWADPVTYPGGYYFGMAGDFAGREWKVETWLLRTPAPPQDWIQDRLTDENRLTILRLKHMKNIGTLRASSYDIYRAVLLGGVREPAEAEEWLRNAREQKG